MIYKKKIKLNVLPVGNCYTLLALAKYFEFNTYIEHSIHTIGTKTNRIIIFASQII